jgi:HSP20 family molecular chaperone IbpA
MSSACLSLESESLGTVPRDLRANVFAHRWGVVVQVFVPGCTAKEVRLRLSGDSLTVVAAMPNRHTGVPLICEREIGECERDFTLTADLDVSRLSRTLVDGVLTLVIPRHGALLSPGSES